MSLSKVKQFLSTYDFSICQLDVNIENLSALGIGDILITFNLVEKKLLKLPIYINLYWFTDDKWYQNPINALQFRLDLINFLLILFERKISRDQIKFIYIETTYLNQHKDIIKCLSDWQFDIDKNMFRLPENIIESKEKYIVFHTKTRLYGDFDYIEFKNKIKQFFGSFKFNGLIYILGEREFPETKEKNIHGITTIYEELLELKNNNKVTDLTLDSIYNNLKFENYKKDMNIIAHSSYNFLFGLGGQMVTCLCFNFEKTFSFIGNYEEISFNPKLNDHLYRNLDDYLLRIKELEF
jgi:hypothetical protein